jgi:hypothetical protein
MGRWNMTPASGDAENWGSQRLQLAGRGSIPGTVDHRLWQNDSAVAVLDLAEV